MRNTIGKKAIGKIAGIIAFSAIIAFSFVACGDDGGGSSADNALNGTWRDSYGDRLDLNNGRFSYFDDSTEMAKGTYSTSGSNITIALTDIRGSMLGTDGALLGIQPNQFYSRQQLKNFVVEVLSGTGLYTQAAAGMFFESEIGPAFDPVAGTYELSGNTLKITSNGALFNGTETFTRQ